MSNSLIRMSTQVLLIATVQYSLAVVLLVVAPVVRIHFLHPSGSPGHRLLIPRRTGITICRAARLLLGRPFTLATCKCRNKKSIKYHPRSLPPLRAYPWHSDLWAPGCAIHYDSGTLPHPRPLSAAQSGPR